jgi:hypothetical protein
MTLTLYLLILIPLQVIMWCAVAYGQKNISKQKKLLKEMIDNHNELYPNNQYKDE